MTVCEDGLRRLFFDIFAHHDYLFTGAPLFAQECLGNYICAGKSQLHYRLNVWAVGRGKRSSANSKRVLA